MPENSFLGTEMQPDYIPTSDEKTLAILSHILTLVAPILAPLIIYLVKKNESRFVEWHAKESLNFQITVAIIIIILFLLVTYHRLSNSTASFKSFTIAFSLISSAE